MKIKTIKSQTKGSDLIEVEGIVGAQTPAILPVFEKMIPLFDNIIELGTSKGALTLLLDHYRKEDSNLTTWEMNPNITDELVKERPTIDNKLGNVFADDVVGEIRKLIQQEGRTILLCDGGKKHLEVILYSQYLKPKDVLMCHDYVDDANQESLHQASRFQKEVNWKFASECTWNMISEHIDKNNLATWRYEEHKKIMWGSFIKQ